MLEKTPYYLCIRGVDKVVHKFETHNEKQYGDIALRAPNGDIVYASTGPTPPQTMTNKMGVEPKYVSTDKHLFIRMPNDEKRYLLTYTRPTAMTFKFTAKIGKWQNMNNTTWSARDIVSPQDNQIKLTGIYYGFSNGKIVKARFHLSGLPKDKRWPVKVFVSYGGAIGNIGGYGFYNESYVHNQDARYARYDCSPSFLPLVSQTSQMFKKVNQSVTVTSTDTYMP